MSAVVLVALSAVLAAAAGDLRTDSLISVFTISCPDGSMCPLNATEATLAQVAGRKVADKCCAYFRGGCCTAAENQELATWFHVALGLGIGLPVILALVLAVIICGCVYYKLRYTSPLESRVERDVFKSPATRSYSRWNTYANESTEKALFHSDN